MYLQEKNAEPDARTPAAGEGGGASTFGHYRLERELGRGCSSVVYAAHDGRRAVALKVLTLPQTPDEGRKRDLEERFRREAQAVSTLSHPNIVAIYDVGLGEDGRQFIAMEHLPGETLRRRLSRESPLSVPVAVAIGVRVAEALHYAHGRGIIHRDVKPDNIFLAHDGAETATPKLMDFGVAHVSSNQALTQDGMIIGSPAYMSPEQIHGLPPDARTDVFALAVTLAEMVTGVKPFEAETIPALMQKILHHDPDLRAVADRRLQRVLAKALAKRPGARYPDAMAFAQALRRPAPFAVPVPVRLPRLGAVGLGGLALASLAALPFLTGHPPQASARMASVAPATAASPLPPRSVRRVDAGGDTRSARRQAHAPVRAAAYPLHHKVGDGKEGDAIVVRIVERASGTGLSSRPLRSALISRPPQRPATRLATFTAAPPMRPVAARMFGSRAPRPAALPAVRTPADAPPSPLSRPMPHPTDGMDRTDAVVRVRLGVDERGEVTEAYVLRSSGSRALDDAALDAVGHWEYAPAVRAGRPVPGTALETVEFAAADGRQEQGPGSPASAASLPRPLSRPMPHPPDGMDRTDAVVRVRLSVDERGEVTEAYVLRSSGSRALDDAALDAVGYWEYAPAVRGGRPVPGTALETVEFAP